MSLKNPSFKQLKLYRKFFFPACVADQTHTPYLSLERKDDWVMNKALQCFIDSSDTSGMDVDGMSYDEENGWEGQPLDVLQSYRVFILPDIIANNPFFSIDNAETWILPGPFQLYLQHHSLRSEQSLPPAIKTEPGFVSGSLGKRKLRSPAPEDGVIVISSDDEILSMPVDKSSNRNSKSGKRCEKLHKRFKTEDGNDGKLLTSSKPVTNLGAIDISASTCSESDSMNGLSKPQKKATVKRKPRKRASAKAASAWYDNIDKEVAIKITKKERVENVEHMNTIPAAWDVKTKLTAYVVDLKDHEDFKKPDRSVISWIRHEGQASWGGSSGHRDGDTYVLDLFGEEKVLARRAELTCNGIKTCEFINRGLLEGFQGWELDSTEMERFWAKELDANEEESSNPNTPLARFYLRVMESKCKDHCTGKPVIRELQTASRFGKNHFIGCSAWRVGDQGVHRSIQIDKNIDEDTFLALFKNKGVMKEQDLTVHGSCSVVVHPRSHKSICPFTHIIDGKVQSGQIVQYQDACPSRLIIFEPVDTSIRKAIVIPKSPHNHPRHTHVKPTIAEKELLQKAASASGQPRITVKSLRTGAATAEILSGRTWEEALPSMCDNKATARWIKNLNKSQYPRGLDWEGVQHECDEVESKLPTDARYIHSVTSKSDIRMVVTMHPGIVKHIHSVRFLAIDYTFKRIRGKFNEWEVASMLDRYNMRVSLASLYCNHATRSAFKLLVSEFFETIQRVTGKKLEFHLFNHEAKLRCLIFDAEAAQMQGCGDAVLPMNVPEVSHLNTRDPIVLVQHIAKTCVLHFYRNIDELPKSISRQVINRLKTFPGLSTHEDIALWRDFCCKSSHKEVVNWYKQKEMHPWYLPSLNPFMSPMDTDSWNLCPDDSNVAETAHAARNAETSINAPILLAIQEARLRDGVLAAQFEAFERGANLPKRWNGPRARETRSAARRDATFQKVKAVAAARGDHEELEGKLGELAQLRQESLERKKQINERLKEISLELAQSKSSLALPGFKELKTEKEKLQVEHREGVERHKKWAVQKSDIQQELQELQQGVLKNSRVRDPRPGGTNSRLNKASTSNSNQTTLRSPGKENIPRPGTYTDFPPVSPIRFTTDELVGDDAHGLGFNSPSSESEESGTLIDPQPDADPVEIPPSSQLSIPFSDTAISSMLDQLQADENMLEMYHELTAHSDHSEPEPSVSPVLEPEDDGDDFNAQGQYYTPVFTIDPEAASILNKFLASFGEDSDI